MARAAVKAKQAERANAAVAKPARGKRKHASGGNPSQDLFFVRIRRKQRWVLIVLAVLFAVSFTALGVGSGSGGLEQVWNSILGNSNDAVGKAKSELKTDPAKGYRDLAKAYVTQNDLPNAITAMQAYLKINKTDAAAWTQLGGYEKQQGDTYAQQYQQVLQSSQLANPGAAFKPQGALASQLGSNPIEDYYSQQSSSQTGPLYQKAVTGYNDSLTAFQKAAKYAKRADRPNAELGIYSAAQLVGNTKVALKALQRYVQLAPNSSNLAQIEAACKNLGGSCVPKHKKK